MQFDRKQLSNDTLLDLYRELLKPRLLEERMLVFLRQGGISKWFSGIGQEAISIGLVKALEKDEFILPLHRNLGIFTGRKVPIARLIAQFQGKRSGFTKGRDRSFHFGSLEHSIVGMISHLGPQLAVADGIALADVLDKKERVTAVFSGEGGTSEGDFHEALNLAAVWSLPVLFVVENNGYGLSTPTQEQFTFESFVQKGPAYGMEAHRVDGNNILETYHLFQSLAQSMRTSPRPVLVEALTFRMRGHEEASGTKYVPEKLFETWSAKDPVENFERFLFDEALVTHKMILDIRQEIKEEIEEAIQRCQEEGLPEANTEAELRDVYMPWIQRISQPSSNKKTTRRFVDAISDALALAMDRHRNLLLMGQDIGEYGGVFKVTEGFVERFGKHRVRNTPLCESAVCGAGLGLSVRGYKSVVEMQFADFVSCGFNQIVNNLAKSHYRWGQHADVVVRMPTGAGNGAGPFHSQSNEAWFFHTPGLKVVYPSSPYDAKGLLLAAIEDPNPVLFFEHKALYRSVSEAIPDEYYTIPFGQARMVREGADLSIVTYGMAVHWALQLCEQEGIQADIIDLRSLLPWDKETVAASVRKTGKVLVCHEDCLTGGISGEIASWISEHCFESLDAPVLREGALDTPVPFSKHLEDNFLPKERIRAKLKQLMEY
ncbi:MAG: dehydrogenase E1 component subunit alpha/beta [Cytophagaceae bacterium]|jgi:2-oxoisovalerate dehydrogenase E1 component|nr:dehydrogenase E1 component subunit alpha/beta [Cytophagaceae bacterium]